ESQLQRQWRIEPCFQTKKPRQRQDERQRRTQIDSPDELAPRPRETRVAVSAGGAHVKRTLEQTSAPAIRAAQANAGPQRAQAGDQLAPRHRSRLSSKLVAPV